MSLAQRPSGSQFVSSEVTVPDARAGEERRQAGLKRVLEEVGAGMEIARRGDQAGIDLLGPQRRDRAEIGQQGTLAVRPREMDRDACAYMRVGDQVGRRDAGIAEVFAHEGAEDVVAGHADEGGAQAEPGGATGKDGRRASGDQLGIVDEFLVLAPDRRGIAGQDQVDVELAKNDEVIHPRHGVSQPPRSASAGRWTKVVMFLEVSGSSPLATARSQASNCTGGR